jgi:hypothetical protein
VGAVDDEAGAGGESGCFHVFKVHLISNAVND